jgi:hypothetical protein
LAPPDRPEAGVKKFRQHDKLPKRVAEVHDDPIHEKDLDESRQHRPEDDRGGKDRRDKK